MNVQQSSTSILMASQSDDCLQVALAYQQQGLSALPLKGKRPALDTWAEFQANKQFFGIGMRLQQINAFDL